MTIRSGDVTKVQSLDEFVDEFDVGPIEIMLALTDEQREEIVERFNEIRHDYGEDAVDSVEELPEFILDEWYEWVQEGPSVLIPTILEIRDTEYVHITESGGHWGNPIHTIVELFPEE